MRRLRSLKTGVHLFIVLTFLLSCVLPPAVLAAPTVSITRPEEGALVTGEMVIEVSYKGEPGLPICSVQLFVNGKVAQQWSLPKPQVQGTQSLRYNFSLNAAESYVISARAVDAQGGAGNATVTVRMQKAESSSPDIVPPAINIFYPAHGAKIHGTIQIKATATDNDAVASVFFYVDGKFKCMIMNAPPYVTDLDTTKLSDGLHIVSAKALDRSDNEGRSAEVAILVQNKTLTTGERMGVPETTAIAPSVTPPQVTAPTPAAPGVTPPVIAPPQTAYVSPGVLAPLVQLQTGHVAADGSALALAAAAPAAPERALGGDMRTALPGRQSGAGLDPASATSPREQRVALMTPPSWQPQAPVEKSTRPNPSADWLNGQALAAIPNQLTPVEGTARIALPGNHAPAPLLAPVPTGLKPATPLLRPLSPAPLESDTFYGPLGIEPRLPVAPPRDGRLPGALSMTRPTPVLPWTPMAIDARAGAATVSEAEQTGPRAASAALKTAGPRTASPTGERVALLPVTPSRTLVGPVPQSSAAPPVSGVELAEAQATASLTLAGGRTSAPLTVETTAASTPAPPAPVAAARPETELHVTFDGDWMNLRGLPELHESQPAAPMRMMFEWVDALVLWSAEEQCLSAANSSVAVSVTVGERVARVNNQLVQLPFAPYVKQGHVMVPLQFIADALKMQLIASPDSSRLELRSAR